MRPKSDTLADALTLASTFWAAKGPSSRMMPIRAGLCVDLLGADLSLSKLGPAQGTTLLTFLAERGLQRSTQGTYYAAFRRMLALSGVSTEGWPKAPTKPRRVRDPLAEDDCLRLYHWFATHGYPETADLINVLLQTGMRVEVEALAAEAVQAHGGHLKVTGKGGHERIIPVSDTSILARLISARRVPYDTHLSRWNKGLAALGITSRKPTPHAVRHLFATKAYERSQRNLRAVQELLGHADIKTTAGYIGVDMDTLRHATGCGSLSGAEVAD